MSRSLLTVAPVRSAASVRSGRARRCDRRSRSRPASGDSGRPSERHVERRPELVGADLAAIRDGQQEPEAAGERGVSALPRVAGRARWSCVVLGRSHPRDPSRVRDGSTRYVIRRGLAGRTYVIVPVRESDEEIARLTPIPLVKQPTQRTSAMDTIRSDRPQTLRFAPAIASALRPWSLHRSPPSLGSAGWAAARRRPGLPRRAPVPTPSSSTRPHSAPTAEPRTSATMRCRPESTSQRHRRQGLRRHRRSHRSAGRGHIRDTRRRRLGRGLHVKVENLDPTTLRLMGGLPDRQRLALYIDRSRTASVRRSSARPDGPTDAMAFDRELVLTFAQPISASQVETFLQGGLDTPG